MNKRAARTVIVVLEVAALVLAAGAACVSFIAWRLESGPVSANLFTPSVKFALERRLPDGFTADIESLQLARAPERGAYQLQVDDLRIFDADDAETAYAPSTVIEFALR